MLHLIDYLIIGFYFVFLAGLGWYFRRAAGANSSEYFRGGGRMAWWLVGATAFMGSFSAWTFTGAAGLAYDHGLVVMTIFLGNAGTYLMSAWRFGPWFRQLRAVTVMEAVRQRLGPVNEQVFTWMQLPIQILVAAIWLYGLAIFLGPVFKLDLQASILVCGAIVIVLSTLGGSWAVATGDFMQALLLMPITLLAAWLSLRHAGGIGTLLSHLPTTHFDLSARTVSGYGVLWIVGLTIERLFLSNRLTYAGRYFCVADSASARRAGLLTAGLFVVGSIIWFIPPLAARSLGMDLTARFPGLSSPGEAAYAAMAVDTLPAGLLGLLVTAIIAATLSSMDEGLNRNAGIFVRSVYLPLIRPKASEREQVRVGKITTVFMGILVILLALKYSTWRDFGVLKLMFNLAAMIGVPSGVPVFWCLFTRRAPDWGAWSTVLVGFALSAVIGVLPREEWFRDWIGELGYGQALAWLHANEYGVAVVTITVVCSLWFWATAWWSGQRDPQRQREVNAFFTAMRTPVLPAETAGIHLDDTPRRVARLCTIYAVFLGVMALLPNSLAGRGGLAFCALFFVAVGVLLQRASARAIAANTRAESQPPAMSPLLK
jgi:Na+/proline symporter